MRRGECDYTYPGGKVSIWDLLATSCSQWGADGVPGGDGVRPGVGCHCLVGGGARIPFCLLHVCTIHSGDILPIMASIRLVLTKHSPVTLYLSLHIVMPMKLNSPHHRCSDIDAMYPDQVLRFLYCDTWKLSLGHFGYIECHAHVGLFQLHQTSLCCNHSRHVENLQEISCCF